MFAALPKLSRGTWWASLKGVMRLFDEQNLGLVAAGVAFYGLLSLFPAIAAVIAIWSAFADPAEVTRQIDMLQGVIPDAVHDLLSSQVDKLISAPSGTLSWASVFSIGLALWLARAGVSAIIRGLNMVYRERNRGGIRHILVVLALTVALVGMALVAMIAVIVIPIVIAILPLGFLAETAIGLVKWLIMLAVLIFGLGLVFRMGPHRRGPKLPWVTPGALLATLLWTLASVAFSVYLRNFGSYNEIYGSIGAVIAMMMWLYISAFVVLLGAALNAELELRTRPDTTIGKDRPMGERGAYVADNYAESG